MRSFLIFFAFNILLGNTGFCLDIPEENHLIGKINNKGLINWTAGFVDVTTEINIPEVDGKYVKNSAEAVLIAEKKALNNSLYDINHMIQNISVDSKKRIGYYKNSSPTLSKRIDKLVRAAKLIDKVIIENGLLRLVFRIKLNGMNGIMGINEIYNPEFSCIEFNNKPFYDYSIADDYYLVPVDYEMLVIDARELKLKPVLSPCIYDELGNLIYGSQIVDGRHAIENGIVKYIKIDYNEDLLDKITGRKTYFIPAIRLGESKSDLIIHSDFAKILLSTEKTKLILKQCRVIILLGPCE